MNEVGWILDGNRWYYRYPDGTYLKNGWGFIGNIWYLFDANGMMLTGWQMKNGVYYYMNGDGKMQTGCFSTTIPGIISPRAELW